MSDEDLRQAWERGKPVEADRERRSPTTVLSLRLSDEIMQRLSEQARERDKPIGTLARELIEVAVTAEGPVTPPSLASMFTRWIKEALQPAAAPMITWSYVSSTVAKDSWLSFERTIPGDNYELVWSPFGITGPRAPLVTSRTMETDTEPAGEVAA
jgi:hypothetical protein